MSLSLVPLGMTVTGSLHSTGHVEVEGIVEGEVRGTKVLLGANAQVRGIIIADEAVIAGYLEGSLRCRTVRLTSTARVAADLYHERQLAIEPGAEFAGKSRNIAWSNVEPEPAVPHLRGDASRLPLEPLAVKLAARLRHTGASTHTGGR